MSSEAMVNGDKNELTITFEKKDCNLHSLHETVQAMIKEGRKIYHFGFGETSFPIFQTAKEALQEFAGSSTYLPVQGIPKLRQAICNFHARFHGLTDFNPDNVIVGPGSKELIYLLITVFNGTVFLLSPTWTTYKNQTDLAGKKTIIIPTDMSTDWKITPEVLEKNLAAHDVSGNKLLVFCNPDNPTGTCYSDSELLALSKVFRKHKFIVLCDEIYAGLHYERNHKSMVKHYPDGSILTTGLSKWASAGGWRFGYQIFPPELYALFVAVKNAASHTYSCAPAPIQFAAVEAFSDLDRCEEYMKHTTRIMAAVSYFSVKELRDVGVKVVASKGGYYIFPDFEILRPVLERRKIKTCQEMCALILEEASVAMMSGGPAFLRPLEELTTRLCYVNFDGRHALEASRELGLETPLPPTFVKEHCTAVHDGINALTTWIRNQLQPRGKETTSPGE